MRTIPPIGKCEHNVLLNERCVHCETHHIFPSPSFPASSVTLADIERALNDTHTLIKTYLKDSNGKV